MMLRPALLALPEVIPEVPSAPSALWADVVAALGTLMLAFLLAFLVVGAADWWERRSERRAARTDALARLRRFRPEGPR